MMAGREEQSPAQQPETDAPLAEERDGEGLVRTIGNVARWLFGTRLSWQFTIPSLLLMVVVGFGVSLGLSKYLAASIEDEALAAAIRDAEEDAYKYIVPRLSPDDLAAPMVGPQYLDLDRLVREHILDPGTVRVKIWNRNGTVIYSDEPSLVGRTFPVEGVLAEALAGETASEVSDLGAEENVAEQQYGRLLQVYTPIRFGGSPEVLGAFEVYQDYGPIAVHIAREEKIVYLAVGVGMGFVYLALLIVHARGTIIIGRQREKLIRQAQELRRSYELTLDALGLALDLRDHVTEDHCRRVRELATTVGRELGLSEEELKHIDQAAVVHDIGKMAVPDAILLKPGPLTGKEWKEMRRHPELAYEMLKNIPFLKEAAEIVYAHQEKYDGTGYPRGLKGEEIPLGARIFAVVDAYDAITSDRPYRKARSHRQAVEEIRRCSGTQFDPEVVRVFCQAEKKGLIKTDKHKPDLETVATPSGS